MKTGQDVNNWAWSLLLDTPTEATPTAAADDDGDVILAGGVFCLLAVHKHAPSRIT